MSEDLNLPEEITNLDKITSKKANSVKKIDSDKFVGLVSKEFSNINKFNKFIKKLENYLFDDAFIFGADPKDVIRLYETALKYSHLSKTFLSRLYEISTKNDILKSYLSSGGDLNPEGVVSSQSARVRSIVNRLREQGKEIEKSQEKHTVIIDGDIVEIPSEKKEG